MAFYEKELGRQTNLVAVHAVSQTGVDQAAHARDHARQALASTEQQLAGIVANLGGDPNLPTEQHPRYLAAVAARDKVARDLRHTVVLAPFAGIVTNVSSLQPGTYLPASTGAFDLVATDHVWIEANPKETDLDHVRPGQPATVSVDTYGDAEWTGSVASLSPASGAEFSLLPAQNTTGNWVKVVQRIPIRVRLDVKPDQPPLRAGMSVEVEIDTGHARGLPRFFRSAFAGVAQ